MEVIKIVMLNNKDKIKYKKREGIKNRQKNNKNNQIKHNKIKRYRKKIENKKIPHSIKNK